MTCKNCGREIREDAKECPYCHHTIRFVPTIKCPNCGKIIRADADVCPNCLRTTPKGIAKLANKSSGATTYGESKKGIGVLLCLFLGVIGLIIGLLLYPAYSEERSTFIKGWVGTFVVTIVVAIILVVAVTCKTFSRYY